MGDAPSGFVPMGLVRTAFSPTGRGRGSAAERDMVVPIRAESALHEPTPLYDLSNLPQPRTIFPIPEPEPASASVPDEPSGPSAEDIAVMVQEAEKRGFQKGAESLQPALDERRESEERLAQIANELDAARAEWASEAREDLTNFAVSAVHHLIGDIPELLEMLLRQRLKTAVEHLSGSRRVVVRVAPRDVGLALEAIGDREGWDIRADMDVQGGCIATSESGELDGSVQAGLEAVDAAVAAWRAEEGG